MANNNHCDGHMQVTEVSGWQINATRATDDKNPSQGSKLMSLGETKLRKESPQATVWVDYLSSSMASQTQDCETDPPFGTCGFIVQEVGRCPVDDCGGRRRGGGRERRKRRERVFTDTGVIIGAWCGVKWSAWTIAAHAGYSRTK